MRFKPTLYWGSTLLISFMMLASAGKYFFNYDEVTLEFIALGYPVYLIHYIATAKTLAVLVILNNQMKRLVEWAYAGLFFDFILATIAHLYIQDGEYIGSIFAVILLLTSYLYKDHVRS
ncbi:DoxX family protein [Flavobacteriaceae bacterium]|nr:DoxX family protein [Flavobacteriaceae bacterium]